MQLKRSMELTPYDLPRIESPFLAAAEVGRLISSGRLSAIDLRTLLRVRPDSREPLQTLATRQVADGDLFLIHDQFDPGPLSPVIDWRDNPELKAGGEWKPSSQLPFGLGYALQELNHRQLTPDDVKRGPIPGASGTAAEHARTSDQNQERTATTATSASVMATTLDGIKLANESGQVPEEEQEPEIHVEVGIFTDGTLNNLFNSQQLQDSTEKRCANAIKAGNTTALECEQYLALIADTSYANAPTNIAKLWEMYPNSALKEPGVKVLRYPVYAPGVGTRTGQEDSLIDAGTGLGRSGVVAQVAKAFDEIRRAIAIDIGTQSVARMTIDLFGFSRGAAAARHASNEICKGADGMLGKMMSEKKLPWPDEVSIRFIGLFDTVAGIVNLRAADFAAHNHRNHPVNLHMSHKCAGRVLHIIAEDEKRKNFALNSIKESDDSLPENFQEISIPGAHSDIGGGYAEETLEDVQISPRIPIPTNRIQWPEQTVEWDSLEELRSNIAEEKWIGHYSLPSKYPVKSHDEEVIENPTLRIDSDFRPHPAVDGQMEIMLRMHRTVRGDYSLIPLFMMVSDAKEAGVPFPDEELDIIADKLPGDLSVLLPKFESALENRANKIDLSDSEKDLLRQRYIHYSAHFNDYQSSIAGQPARISFFRNVRPNVPVKKRLIHPN